METPHAAARMEVYGCLIHNLHKLTIERSMEYYTIMEDASFFIKIRIDMTHY